MASDTSASSNDPRRTSEAHSYAETEAHAWNSSEGGSGSLEVRCPNCHEPARVAVDTMLTDLTCGACGSHFGLVDQSQATRMAPPLSQLGRFELVERIGVGGFGSVWKARDKELDRTVAIKIPRQGDMTPEEQEQFFREARAAAQLRHPNIASVHEVGRDGDSIFIVSDFIRGVTLGDWLTGQQLTNREAAQLCATIADALQHAHEQGVVHRDLKPANIMLDGGGQPHLMDFGLARREVGEVTMTVEGNVLGTPAYMSPEQAAGEAHTADRRSDVYSLGVILFQLLTGELPFRGNARMLMHQVIHDEPPSPRKLNSNIVKDLETITLKCLEKEPAKRYQTAREVADELQRFLQGEPIHARPVGSIERSWRWAKRRPTAAALLVLLVAVTVIGPVVALQQASLRRDRERALETLDQQAVELQDLLVRNFIERGAAANEAGKTSEAISLAAAAYLQARPDDPLRESARNLLAGWSAATNSPFVHDDTVVRVAVSPDGDSFVTGTAGGSARIWDVHSGLPIGQPLRHSGYVAVAYSADGQRVITGSGDGTVRIWDAKSGSPLTKPMHHNNPIYAAAFSPDGQRVITVSPRETPRQWDAVTGESLVAPIPLQSEGRITRIVIRPDGLAFATGDRDGLVQVWDAKSGEPLGEPIRHGERISALAFSPDGRLLATGSWDETAAIWDLKTRKQVGASMHHSASAETVAFSPDGESVATGSWDGLVRLWSAESGEPLGPPLNYGRGIRALAFFPDGRILVTGTYDRTARLWDVSTGTPVPLALDGTRDSVRDLDSVIDAAFSPDGRTLLTANHDRTASFWDVATGERLGQPLAHESEVTAVAFSSDGRTVSTSCADGTVLLWDAETRRRLAVPLQHEGRIGVLEFSPDGQTLAVGSDDGTVRLWDAKSDRAVGQDLQHGAAVIALAFAPDGRTLFTLTAPDEGMLRRWNLATDELFGTPFRPNQAIPDFALSPDATMEITGGLDNKARLWDVASCEQLGKPLQHNNYVYCVAFSPEGSMVATGCRDRHARLWDVATGKIVGQPLPHDQFVVDVAFSPTGRDLLAISEAHTARLWRLPQIPDDPDALRKWALARSGFEVDAQGSLRPLSQREWFAALGIQTEQDTSHDGDAFIQPPVAQLRPKVGQELTIEFDVARAGSGDSSLQFLNSLADYTHTDCFTVVIDTSRVSLLTTFGELMGQRIRVTGRLSEYRGRLEVSVDDVTDKLSLRTSDGQWVSLVGPHTTANPGQEFPQPSVSVLRTEIGQPQEVLFRVQAVGGIRRRYLNSMSDFGHPDCFTVIVEQDQVDALASLGISDPNEELPGRLIRVTGIVREHNGQVEIRVSDVANQLQIVEPSELREDTAERRSE